MAQIRIGGDPENYMEPPTMTIGGDSGGGDGGGDGVNFINGLLDLLGINRSPGENPETMKQASRRINRKRDNPKPANQAGDADTILDTAGAALAAQDQQSYQPVQVIALPPSLFGQ